jgi:F0F1-type ATP synthase assembly protein I
MNVPLSVKLVIAAIAILLVDVGIAITTESHAAAVAGWWLIYLLIALGLIAALDIVVRAGRIVLKRRGGCL